VAGEAGEERARKLLERRPPGMYNIVVVLYIAYLLMAATTIGRCSYSTVTAMALRVRDRPYSQ
jgi:hypothetical protein